MNLVPLPPDGPSEIRMYFHQIKGVWAGHPVKSWQVHTIAPASAEGWLREDQILLIEEGRRQLDDQRSTLENLRARGQYLVTSNIALVALYATLLTTTIALASVAAFVTWLVGVAVLVLSTLGGTAVLVGAKALGGVDTAKFSQSTDSPAAALADAYANCVGLGENTVATQITVFRDAVALTLVAVLLLALAWCLGVFG